MKKPTVPSSVIEQLQDGLNEVREWKQGGPELRSHAVEVPEPASCTPQDIKKARAELNMSQSEFAQLLQVSFKTVQAWEAGRRRPGPGQARWIEMYTSPGWIERVRMPQRHPRAPKAAVQEVSPRPRLARGKTSPRLRVVRRAGGAASSGSRTQERAAKGVQAPPARAASVRTRRKKDS